MSCYEMRVMPKDWVVQLGYDRPLRYYFLTIVAAGDSGSETEEYIFHNLCQGGRYALTPGEVEQILQQHGIGLPYELAGRLVEDGQKGGYPEAAAKDIENLRSWEAFCHRVQSSSAAEWRPMGALPDRWYRLDAPRN